MSNLIEIDLLILDSNGIAIKNINVRTKYTNGTSLKDEKTNNFGHRIVSASSRLCCTNLSVKAFLAI